MSWLQQHQEKAALGGSAVAALILAVFGWLKVGSVDEDFAADLRGRGNNTTAVPEADALPKAAQSLALDRAWAQANDAGRAVDLFTGIPLFIRGSEPTKAIDLLKDAPVHPPIKNTWWVENRLDPGFADSPQRDPDDDGFSNLEEYTAGTDPNSAASIPDLVDKLRYVRDDGLAWALRPTFGSDGAYPFRYYELRNNRWFERNKLGAGEMVSPGGAFYNDEPAKGRFVFAGSETRRETSASVKIEMDVTYVRVEDQRPNKKGRIYELPAPLSEERLNEHVQYDRNAVLTLEALGNEGKEFPVEENTRFALPPDAAEKQYLLKEVTPDRIVVEWTDAKGAARSVNISKGSMPAASGSRD
jgi:hypothetical protein